jgi:hypothetical protein
VLKLFREIEPCVSWTDRIIIFGDAETGLDILVHQRGDGRDD